jgi:hypothetical protein
MLDDERAAIDDLAAVDVGGDPTIGKADVVFPLSLHSSRSLSFVEKLRVAIEAIDHLQDRLDRFPELLEILEDDAPPIATT